VAEFERNRHLIADNGIGMDTWAAAQSDLARHCLESFPLHLVCGRELHAATTGTESMNPPSFGWDD